MTGVARSGSPRYWELTVGVPDDASEGLTNFVWELGALGVVEEEPADGPPRLRAFFAESTDTAIFPTATIRAITRLLRSMRDTGGAFTRIPLPWDQACA